MSKKKITIEEAMLKLLKKYSMYIYVGMEFPQNNIPLLGKIAVWILGKLGAVPRIRFIKKNVENTR